MQQLTVCKYNFDEREEFKTIALSRGDDKSLEICYAPNFDLYFTLKNFKNDPKFIIGKDNYMVYSIFDRLYHDIINANIFKLTEDKINSIVMSSESEETDYHEALRKEEDKIRECNEMLSTRDAYKRLVSDGVITWRSDDFSLEAAPFFSIKKLLNAYIISFDIPKVIASDIDPFEEIMLKNMKHSRSISVRLRNSGSRFHPFNFVFMRVYNDLNNLSEYHQIHMEENLINKRIENGESLKRILLK